MDFLQTIEDPRHTPGKRHGYAKEQLSPQAFSSNNQKSLISSFITTPPVAKPQNYLIGYNINNADKFYQVKEEQQKRNNYTSLYPSQKSAFFAYRNSPNQKPPRIQIEPPSIIDGLPNDSILRPKPRYATSASQCFNKNITESEKMYYSENNNNSVAQTVKVNRIDDKQEGVIAQQRSTKVTCSEFGFRELPMTVEKKVDDLSRSKNFKNILNKFQIASDRVLQQQKQRERIRLNANDHKLDEGFNTPDWGQSIKVAYSERNYKLTKNKQQNLRAFTISLPTDRKNIRNSLPKQWIMKVNDTHVGIDVEQRSPTISGISAISQSSQISSSHKPPNGINNLRLVSMKQRAFIDNCSHRNKPMMRREFRYAQSTNRSGSIREIDAQKNSTNGCIIRCASTESYKKFVPPAQMSMSSNASLIPPSESRRMNRNISSETEDDDSAASVIGLYKQMTSNHLEILEYASLHLTKFFVNHNPMISKANLQKLKLDDLIFESMIPIFSKCSTHFFNAFLPHDGPLSSAINVIAEPVSIHPNPMKLDLLVGNIWNPPTLVEIKTKQDEEQRILRGTLQQQNNQKYCFLIIPRYNLFTFGSFAANYGQNANEKYEQMICFILLQLVCALKSFQLNGIEAISDDLSEFILLCKYTRTNHNICNMDHLPRILLLQESLKMTNKKPIIGLCDYGLKILSTMLNLNRNSLANFITPIQECAKALQQDKSNSLTEAKNALEFGMFVGHDASFSDEEDVQAWIDLKRADYVNYLFREVAGGSCSPNEVYERLRLQFLLSITPRTLLKMFENMKSAKILNKISFYV